ncbi:MAG: elongation factor Ts [Chloroflexi bacterium]|nr:elongation factor Ts [Chloroflexota bacterium]
MDCRNALIEASGDIENALHILKQRSLFLAEKKAKRSATQGIVECYIHTGGRIGAMVELNCETDFVARTDEFKALAHDLAMQIAAQSPRFTSRDDIPQGSDVDAVTACLLCQPFIKDLGRTVQDMVTDTIAKVGENIKVGRFARFEVGEER